ncbi:MAG TPA: Rid family detoxifying hydrolase [Solirubrobacteraceae bacterium]|jgi:2-iminobutanoate/2-iminopropanoate deaminase
MPLERQTVDAPGAPAAVGPYSHAVRAGDFLFCSGQVALDAESGELVGDTPGEQARVVLGNLAKVCEAAGTSLDRAIRCTVYLTDLPGAWTEVNEVYGSFFPGSPPARVAFGVAALPKGAQVEIDAIVAL